MKSPQLVSTLSVYKWTPEGNTNKLCHGQNTIYSWNKSLAMYTDLSLFLESLARILLWFISEFLERDLIDGHMTLHNTDLYGTLVRSYSLGCCSQSSVEASGLNLFILFKGGMFAIWAIVRLAYYYCLLLGHLGL